MLIRAAFRRDTGGLTLLFGSAGVVKGQLINQVVITQLNAPGSLIVDDVFDRMQRFMLRRDPLVANSQLLAVRHNLINFLETLLRLRIAIQVVPAGAVLLHDLLLLGILPIQRAALDPHLTLDVAADLLGRRDRRVVYRLGTLARRLRVGGCFEVRHRRLRLRKLLGGAQSIRAKFALSLIHEGDRLDLERELFFVLVLGRVLGVDFELRNEVLRLHRSDGAAFVRPAEYLRWWHLLWKVRDNHAIILPRLLPHLVSAPFVLFVSFSCLGGGR